MSVVSSKNTQIPWVLPKAPLQNYPNISISWKPFGKFGWNNWGCLKTKGNVPNFDDYGLSGQTLGHFAQVISSLARQAVVLKPLNYPVWKRIDISDVGPPEEADGWDMLGFSHVMEL